MRLSPTQGCEPLPLRSFTPAELRAYAERLIRAAWRESWEEHRWSGGYSPPCCIDEIIAAAEAEQ